MHGRGTMTLMTFFKGTLKTDQYQNAKMKQIQYQIKKKKVLICAYYLG